MQLTLHPLEDGGGWTFQVHSRPYGVRDAEWSLNADGTVVTGVEDEPVPDPADSIDAAIERLNRTRPQQLFETFADMELAWGPTWSTSLKSLWVGEGEAIGDISVGEELAEHLGTEPMHPVLLDLCTGVAFPAFPALACGRTGGQPICSCRCGTGGWRCGRRCLGGFTAARGGTPATSTAKPRSSISISSIGMAATWAGFASSRSNARPERRCCAGSAATPPGCCTPSAGTRCRLRASSERRRKRERHLAGRRIRRTGGRPAGLHLVRPDYRSGALGQLLAQAHERGVPISGIVWRSAGPSAEESSAESAARLETEIANLLSAVHTLQADEAVKLPGGLWIITERAVATESGEPVDPVQAALWGLGRTIVNEEPALRCRLVDYDGSTEAVHSLAGSARRTRSSEPELALRQGKFLASRLLPWSRSGHLAVPRATDYAPGAHRTRRDRQPASDRDGSAAAGRGLCAGPGGGRRSELPRCAQRAGPLPGRSGADRRRLLPASSPNWASGVTGLEVGQRVYGFMQGAFASRFNVPAQFLAPIPDGVSAVEAATIPAAALTVRLAFDWAKLKPGDQVLIHAASGGVGLAAIQMAQQHGAIVFATASTYKRATLRKLGVKYVYDSRTTDFADQILADTDGAGVDVVLNSLTNEGFVEATVRATAQNGRFAEIAKRDIWTPEQMAAARPDIAYEIVALDAVMFQEPERIRGLLAEVSEGLANGEWTPLPAEIYPLTEAKTAFRRMQQARHIGKIVLPDAESAAAAR